MKRQGSGHVSTLSDKYLFEIKRTRRDSGYSTESESDQSHQNDVEKCSPFINRPNGSKENLLQQIDVLVLEKDLFCKPSSVHTRLSDSLFPDLCSQANTSVGSTNVLLGPYIDDMIFENSSVSQPISDDMEGYKPCNEDPFASDGLCYQEESSAIATNYPSLFSNHFIEDSPLSSSALATNFQSLSSNHDLHDSPIELPLDCPADPSPTTTIYNTVAESNPRHMKIKMEKKDARVMSKPITNFSLTASNLEVELSNFLLSVHATDRFKLVYGRRSKTVSLIDLVRQEFRDLVFEEGSVYIAKITPDKSKSKKFASIDKKSKRSLASCQTITRGLALAEKFEEIQAMDGLDSKTKNNRFTNFQRKDRSSGAKLEKDFLEKNDLSSFASFSDIERQCKISLAIFHPEGYFEYLSPRICKKIVFFFEDEDDIYYVKSLKGFIRAE